KLKVLHDARMESSKEYQFLLQDIEDFKDMDKEKLLPLNEVELKKQRDEQEAKNLDKENERRISRGLEPLAKGETKTKKEDAFDFLQSESIKIMTDFITIDK